MRTFEGGATRDDDTGKLDFEGYLSPVVLQRFGEYMLKHQQTAAGMRGSDNWQSGMDREVYMKSLLRHVMDVWMEHRGYDSRDGLEEALCAVMFNTMGYLFEVLRDESTETVNVAERIAPHIHVENPEDDYKLPNQTASVIVPLNNVHHMTFYTPTAAKVWCGTCREANSVSCNVCMVRRISDETYAMPTGYRVERTH